jgi:hypothetical protein
MALPQSGSLGVFDPTLPLRGWPQFAADVEAMRRREGAAWVGTQGYGTLSQLTDEGAIAAPLLQVVEPDRYHRAEQAAPDFSKPGLLVDLDRRMARSTVLRCFTRVTAVGQLDRGSELGPSARYTAFLVSGPKRDVWTQGCPVEITPGVWK